MHALIFQLNDILRPLIDRLALQQEHQQTVRSLRTAIHTDALTNCLNRRALLDDPPTGAYGLLAIDVDHFKDINDTHGHPAGYAKPVTFSIGVTASHRDRHFAIQDAIQAADAALYQTKRAGRNQIAYSASLPHT